MLTHIVRSIFRMLTNIKNANELQTWYTDGGRRSPSAAGAMTSKVKGQGHKFTSSVRLMSASSEFREENAVFVSLEAGGGLPCRPNQAATLVTSYETGGSQWTDVTGVRV